MSSGGRCLPRTVIEEEFVCADDGAEAIGSPEGEPAKYIGFEKVGADGMGCPEGEVAKDESVKYIHREGSSTGGPAGVVEFPKGRPPRKVECEKSIVTRDVGGKW